MLKLFAISALVLYDHLVLANTMSKIYLRFIRSFPVRLCCEVKVHKVSVSV